MTETILHAGPMKTGSTYLQTCLGARPERLAALGVGFVYVDMHNRKPRQIAAQIAAAGTPPVLILSNEHFARRPPGPVLARALPPGPRRALLVWRPLTQLYPSLYLQRLKGGLAGTRTFAEFTDAQMRTDRAPVPGGPLAYNFAHLDAMFTDAGYAVTWIAHDREALLDRFCAAVLPGNGPALADAARLTPAELAARTSRLSPLRSLSMRLAEAGRALNALEAEGLLWAQFRSTLFIALLDHSDRLREGRDDPAPLLADIAAACAATRRDATTTARITDAVTKALDAPDPAPPDLMARIAAHDRAVNGDFQARLDGFPGAAPPATPAP